MKSDVRFVTFPTVATNARICTVGGAKATVADAPHGILGGLMVLKGNEMKMTFLLLWFVVFASVVSAQDENAKAEKAVVEEAAESSSFPESDIFLFELSRSGGELSVGNGVNVTDRKGYDNQPFFTADSSSFLYTRSEGQQTDVFEYFLGSGETKRVTESVGMEFSPTPSPDNQTISFVTDGQGANQSIWHIKRNDPTTPMWTLKNQPEREPVGYYSWNHETGFIVFWSRYGHSIRLVHESKKLSHYVTGHAVPTTPWIIPGTKLFSFVHRQANGEVWIKELNPETLAVRPLVAIAGSNSHYNWMPDGSVVMVQGAKLFRWHEKEADGWKEVGDLGLESASRVAVSPDRKWLAVVGAAKGEQ